MPRSAKKHRQKGLPSEIHKTLDELCGDDAKDCEDGVWLPASRLKKLLSSIPKSPLYTNPSSSSDSSDAEDSSDHEANRVWSKRHVPKSYTPESLPSIGVFWDIENCHVPSGVSALSVVQMIRDTFFIGYKEAEFVVVCDVTKESPQVIQELNAAQIDLVHVASICKNAADEKLRQALRRFAERHGSPSAVILISGDINFAADLSDLRHRKKIHVILLHKDKTSEALILCSDENYDYGELTKHLPCRSLGKGVVTLPQQMDIKVSNLPDAPLSRVKNRLRMLSANCGGRVVSINKNEAVMRFTSTETAYRARLRMEGEDVFGSKVQLGYPQQVRASPNISEQQTRINQSRSGSDIASSQFSQLYLHSDCSDPPLPMATPVWPSNMEQTNSWYNSTSMETSAPTSHFVTTQQNSILRTILGRQDQLPQQEDHFETSLSSVSSWFHPSLLPPPHPIIPQCTPVMSMPPPSFNKRRSPSPRLNRTSPFPVRADADGSECFQPIQNQMDSSGGTCSPVDLQVSNLDNGIDKKEMRKMILNAFREHVMVMNVNLYTQSDGQTSARVRVPSRQDAQVAVASLHRHKIGNRRVRISVPTQGNRSGLSSPSPQLVKAQVIALLQEVPGNKLPVFKLCELYEKRFLASVSLSELHRMKDVLNVVEEPDRKGRIAYLLPSARRSTTPSFTDMAFSSLKDGQVPEMPYCPIHALDGNIGTGWAEKTLLPLPVVKISLQTLTSNIYALLQSHHGALPLHSLPLCFEADIGKLQADEKGVSVEHLVTWVQGVILKSSPNGGCAKMLTWGTKETNYYHFSSTASEDSSSSDIAQALPERSTSPSYLAAQVNLFGREVVELLRAAPNCQILFVKFIPAFHHHFGRQCRVSSYGFTKLIELLDALPHVVQVIGEGDNRIVMLSCPAQIRRFTSDLLRVLKAQTNKEAVLADLPELFTKCLGRNFEPAEYGLCDISDLVSRVPQNTVVLNPPLIENPTPSPYTLLSLPKREQTPQELERTKYFSKQVVSLLQDAPQCTIPFNRFIPAFHHHFGHQCRLADYGMTKLADLLAAVGDVAEIIESAKGERQITLALPERRNVLADQTRALLSRIPGQEMLISDLSSMYQHQHGIAIDPVKYGSSSLISLMVDLAPYLLVTTSPRGLLVKHVKHIEHLAARTLALLMDVAEGSMTIAELNSKFSAKFGEYINMDDLKELDHLVHIANGIVSLTALYTSAARLRNVIKAQGGSCQLKALASLYVVHWGCQLNCKELGFTNISTLIVHLNDVFCLNGRGNACTVYLREYVAKDSKDLSMENEPCQENKTSTPVSTNIMKSNLSDFGPLTWGALLPTPADNNLMQKVGDVENKTIGTPWLGNLWGLKTTAQNNPWSNGSSLKLWSPPKSVKVITAPDPSELPMPPAGLLEDIQAQANSSGEDHENASMFSDSGIGQPTPPPARRRSRLAAHFNSPIDML